MHLATRRQCSNETGVCVCAGGSVGRMGDTKASVLLFPKILLLIFLEIGHLSYLSVV